MVMTMITVAVIPLMMAIHGRAKGSDGDNDSRGGQRFCANAVVSAELKRKCCRPWMLHNCQSARFRIALQRKDGGGVQAENYPSARS